MAHPSTPLFLLAAVAFAAPDVLATPVQGLRGAISNSTGKARPVAQANLSAPGDDVDSGYPECHGAPVNAPVLACCCSFRRAGCAGNSGARLARCDLQLYRPGATRGPGKPFCPR